MFHQGSLIYIDDFDFSAVNSSLNLLHQYRNKYLIILEVKPGISIFTCFTTTMKQYPLFHKIVKPGCNDILPFNVFHFDNSSNCCHDTGYKFPDLTYIMGMKGQVNELDLVGLYQTYKLDNNITHFGTFKEELVFDIIHCLHLSKTLEGDQKEKLFEIGDKIQIAIQKRAT